MTKTTGKANKAVALKAFGTLFNRRACKATERYWSSSSIQSSEHIPEQMDLPQSGSVCRRSMK